jgi:hypothetical protein
VRFEITLIPFFLGEMKWIMILKCKRCGECCIKRPCFLSKEIPGNTGKCLALKKSDDIYSCGLYVNPSEYLDFGESPKFKCKIFSAGIRSLMGFSTICEKNSAEDLVLSLFGDVPKELVEFLLWEKTCFPSGQTSIIRAQLLEALTERNLELISNAA